MWGRGTQELEESNLVDFYPHGSQEKSLWGSNASTEISRGCGQRGRESGEYSRNKEVGSGRKEHLRGKQMGSGSGAEWIEICLSHEAEEGKSTVLSRISEEFQLYPKWWVATESFGVRKGVTWSDLHFKYILSSMRSGLKETGMVVSRTGVWSWPCPSCPLNPPRVGISLKCEEAPGPFCHANPWEVQLQVPRDGL